MGKHQQLLYAGITATAATLLVSFNLFSREPSTDYELQAVRPIKLYEVVAQEVHSLRYFPARVKASEEATLSFRIAGELVELPVRSGHIVEKGELLAQLDDRDIKNQLAVRQADMELAEAQYRRIASLREKNMVSQADYDHASASLKSAKAAFDLANDQLGYTLLSAPFTGRIARTQVENYQFVDVQQPILDLQEHTTLDITIQVPESLLTQLRQNKIDYSYQPLVQFSHDDSVYPATYKEHATRVTQGTQSYEVTLTMPTPEGFVLYPGMGATLTLDMSLLMPASVIAQGVIVPVTAILKDDVSGAYQVWIYQEGTLEPRTITISHLSQQGITVTSGLMAGDRIAAAGLSKLRPGMSVIPLQRERGI